jgi:signal transduction histidine kinase
MDVELYAEDDEVARLEAQLAAAADASVPAALAWHLRQRDMARALVLADAAEARLNGTPESNRVLARLTLLRAEAAWLRAEMPLAETLLSAAREAFAKQGDAVGMGDTALLDSRLAADLGDGERQRNSLAAAVRYYQGMGKDGDCRRAAALAWALLDSHTRNMPEPALELGALLASDPRLRAGGVDALLAACTATEAFRVGRYGDAEAAYDQAAEQLLRAGLVRQAIYSLFSAGLANANLNLLDRAVLQAERVLALAQPIGWPYCIGIGLRLLGVTEALLGRQEAAKTALLDALAWMAPLRRTSVYVLTALRLAAICRDLGQFDAALATLEDARSAALDGGLDRLMSEILAVMARTLSELGRADEALTLGEEALAIAQTGSHAQRFNTLEALVEIHLHAPSLPPPPGIAAPNAALHYIDLLWSSAGEESGWQPEPRLLASAARAWEQAGDLAKALDFERRGRAALEREGTRKANERLAEARLRHEAETARLEAEQQRRLAAAEAARAATSEASSRTLDELGRIGQEITASLDIETVFEALAGHVEALLDAQSLSILLVDDIGETLVEAFAIEGGERSAGLRVAVDNPSSYAARTLRERRELLLEFDSVMADPSYVPGTQEVRSALFAPLTVGERVLGVLTIQSDTPHAYGERERFIFRTLCAYGAIALDNAAAYRQLGGALAELRTAQDRLVQQEKMAALGALVAGISHELNTPLGVVLLAISGLGDTTAELRGAIEAGKLTRSGLASMTEKQAKLSALAQQNLERLAALISAFRAVSVRVGEDAAVRLDLPEFLSNVAQMAALQLVQQGHRIIVDAAAGLSVETVPDALAETLNRVLANTLDHAFPAGRTGTVTLAARPGPDGQVEISVADDGIGVEPAVLPKVFDPFFTTKRGTGKNVGLGLHVAFNHVTERLKGTIQADSIPGAGTRVTVMLPAQP